MPEGKVRALIIAIEQYGADSGLPALPGTLARALAFRDWLLVGAGADPSHVFFCSMPRVAESTHDATGSGILRAIVDLVEADADDTSRLFVLHTGHGFQLETEQREGATDVVIGADFDTRIGGYNCVRLQQVRNYLQQAIGNCVHYYFVDACRLANPVLVPDLTLPKRTSALGRSTHNSLFSAADGAKTRADSSYPDAVLKALRGQGPAKVWRRDRGEYWVTFPRLVEAVRQQVAAERIAVYNECAGDLPPYIVPVSDVTEVKVAVEVTGARASDRYRLQLFDEARPFEFAFKGGTFDLHVPPGEYEAVLKRGAATLVRSQPPADQRIAIYEGDTPILRFAAPEGRRRPSDVSLGGSRIRLPEVGATSARFRVQREGGRSMDVVRADRLIDAARGNYQIDLIFRGETVGSTTVSVGEGDMVAIDLPEIVHPTRVQRAVSRETAELFPDDLVPQAGAEPASAVLDSSSALVLSLLGTAAIAAAGPYPETVSKLNTFDDLDQWEAAVYVLVEDELGGDVAWGHGQPRPLEAPTGLDGVRHARIEALPGTHDLRLLLEGRPEARVATHAFPGRVTLVVVAQGAPLTVRQYAHVPGHLAGGPAGTDLIEDARFAELVQRRFVDERAVTSDLEADDQQRWERLVAGEFGEPFTSIMAGYELVRRGSLARDPSRVRTLTQRLSERFGPLVDLGVLEALVAHTPPPAEGTPLLADGVAASGPRVREGFIPQDRGGWTLWHRWA